MGSTLGSLSNAAQIIGLVIGILGTIATIICCLMAICYCCKNKNRNGVWAEQSPSPYYYQNRGYGQQTNTPYYYQQQTATTYNEKY